MRDISYRASLSQRVLLDRIQLWDPAKLIRARPYAGVRAHDGRQLQRSRLSARSATSNHFTLDWRP